MVIKAILWDNDGVIIDSSEQVVNSILNTLHIYEIYDKDSLINGGFSLSQLRGLMSKSFSEGELPTSEEIQARFREFFDYNKLIAIKGVKETLLSLDNVKHIIVTNGTKYHINKCLDIVGVKSLFEDIITIEDVSSPKPNPEMLLLACERLGITTDEALFIDDTAHGIEAGINAKVKTLLFSNNEKDIEKVKGKVNYIFDNFYKIPWEEVLS